VKRLVFVVVALVACKVEREEPVGPILQPPKLTAERRALGEKAIAQDCQMCHALDLVESQRLARAAWLKELTKMKGWGAPVPPEDEPLIADVLADRAGADVALPAPREISVAGVAAEVAPDAHPPAGDAKKGAAVYQKACASCHGPTAIGGSGGPALVDRPVVHRAHEFETVVLRGRERMPAVPLEPAAIRDLLAFLRAPRG
jgi:mono/diheme cytochrome c family protein